MRSSTNSTKNIFGYALVPLIIVRKIVEQIFWVICRLYSLKISLSTGWFIFAELFVLLISFWIYYVSTRSFFSSIEERRRKRMAPRFCKSSINITSDWSKEAKSALFWRFFELKVAFCQHFHKNKQTTMLPIAFSSKSSPRSAVFICKLDEKYFWVCLGPPYSTIFLNDDRGDQGIPKNIFRRVCRWKQCF